MSERLAWIVVGSICFVFVGSFIAGVIEPGYAGDAAVGPAMGAIGGVAAGILLSRQARNGDGADGNGAK